MKIRVSAEKYELDVNVDVEKAPSGVVNENREFSFK